jgi:hypothetical protein
MHLTVSKSNSCKRYLVRVRIAHEASNLKGIYSRKSMILFYLYLDNTKYPYFGITDHICPDFIEWLLCFILPRE